MERREISDESKLVKVGRERSEERERERERLEYIRSRSAVCSQLCMASCLHFKLLHQNRNNSKHSKNNPVTFYCDEAHISAGQDCVPMCSNVFPS